MLEFWQLFKLTILHLRNVFLTVYKYSMYNYEVAYT